MVSSTICLTPRLLLSLINRVCRIHSEDLLDQFCLHLSRLSLRNQHQILWTISWWCRSSLFLSMDGQDLLLLVLEGIKEEYYNARKVEGCELEACDGLWREMSRTLRMVHAGISSIVDEQPNEFSLATTRRMSAIDSERRRLAKLLHKRRAVEGSNCSMYSLHSVVEAMDLASRLELQSNSPTIESDGQTASSDSHSRMPAATTDPRSKRLAKLWRERHRIDQAKIPVLSAIRSWIGQLSRRRDCRLTARSEINMFRIEFESSSGGIFHRLGLPRVSNTK
jgi:hypothetical protein